MTGVGAGRLWLLAPAAFLAAAAAPPGDALPETLSTMIREAHPKERKTITNVAKRLYPGQVAAINAMVKEIEREERAAIADKHLVEGWSGEATLGGFRTTGNTDEWGVSASLEAKRKGVRWTHEVDVRIDVKEESGERTQERAYGKYTLRRTLGMPRLFAFGRLSFERDRLQGIQSRFFESVGIGYRLLESRKVDWDVMAGPALRQTDYSDGTAANEPAIFLRTRFDWRISDTLRFSQEADAGLAEGNSTLTSTTSLTSNLYGALSGRLSFGVEVETDPPEDREKTDTYTRVSLVYDF